MKIIKMGELLSGCIVKDSEEIDGKEFEVSNLKELLDIIKNNKSIHLNFYGEENLDLWVRIE
jgi:hypothetical protein